MLLIVALKNFSKCLSSNHQHYLTYLRSLAFKLFKTKFLQDKVEVTWYEDYLDYKEAYRGGAVDVYKPYGTDLYYYDVNSLYPYAMKSNLYPVGESYYYLWKKGVLED